MTDYISREAAISQIFDKVWTKTDEDGYIWVLRRDVIHTLDDIPASDVTEVVKCKDCQFFYNGYNEKYCLNHKGIVVPAENGFCYHGKRRADNDKS